MEENVDVFGERPWQNWDNGQATACIDEYWVKNEQGWRDQLGNYLATEISPNENILEVGCGSGLICQTLLQRGLTRPDRYTGGDISRKMLEIARNRLPNVTFNELDIFRLAIPDRAIPQVLNVHVIQHLPNYADAVGELLRITRDKLVLVSWFTDKAEDQIQFSEPSERWDHQRFYNNFYSLPRLLAFIRTAAGRPVADIRTHHFWEQAYAICVDFVNQASRPQDQTA
jgi:ubiquinone/menaquinone biosynthesis C-methylase UbiE